MYFAFKEKKIVYNYNILIIKFILQVVLNYYIFIRSYDKFNYYFNKILI